jgi:hypothetical protein
MEPLVWSEPPVGTLVLVYTLDGYNYAEHPPATIFFMERVVEVVT